MKRALCLCLAIIMLLLCAACGEKAADAENISPAPGQELTADVENPDEDAKVSASAGGYPLTVLDYFDYETTLETQPERVAVLSGTALNIWYDLGGKSVCTSELSGNLKLHEEYADEIRGLPVVGAVYSLNLEAVIAQDADLIITQAGVQTDATKTLREMDTPVISVLPRTFDDLIETYRVFGRILEKEELAEEKIKALTEERQSYIDQAPAEGKRVVILYLTSNSLSVKLNSSIAGDIATSLGIHNIASDLPPDTIGSENTPLDIEYLVEQDPDLVLVTSMIGSNDLAVETMEKQFAENQAWQSINAVAEGRVFYLPQEYYLYNAGPYYNEAVRYMACTVYPEIYGEVSEWYGK
ncbi:MAG: ABC transporter substrate-binding protein [Oscillospiraceae bacterium]